MKIPRGMIRAVAGGLGVAIVFEHSRNSNMRTSSSGRSFLISGVARIVVRQHCTFLIDSACHTIGRQPYSTKCSARDSFLLAIFTGGEGYPNSHYEFQYDSRNGVKPWQFNPTKWIIWTLSKLGIARDSRRVPADRVRAAERQRRTGEREQLPAQKAPGIVASRPLVQTAPGEIPPRPGPPRATFSLVRNPGFQLPLFSRARR